MHFVSPREFEELMEVDANLEVGELSNLLVVAVAAAGGGAGEG